MKPVVTFEHVSKRFRRGERHDSLRDLVPSLVRRIRGREQVRDDQAFWAVDDVSFQVAPGEALGIIGPNGAGKSTALKLLTRILKPTSGSCAVEGRIGALIEVAAGFHPDLTGRENVFLQGAIMGMKRGEIALRFDEIIEFSGIGEFIDTPVKRYSSGMNARLGFSIAAHLNPHVLIIDEVLAVGDVAFQQRCFRRMEQFLRDGVAIVFVSHNLAAVTQLCQRAVLLNRGKVVCAGTASEAIAAYSQTLQDVGAVGNAEAAIKVATPDRPGGDVWLMKPGDRLRLDVEVKFERGVRNVILGVVIRDLARQLYVYGVSSEALNIPFIAARSGESVRFECEFTVNLARGSYDVEVSVFDMDTQRHLTILRPAAQFTVTEDITYDGIANLFLSMHQVTTAEYA